MTRSPITTGLDPAWYWQGISDLAEKHRRIPRGIAEQNPFLHKTLCFYRQYHDHDTPSADRAVIAAKFPEHFEALNIYSDPMRIYARWIIEALIVSHATPAKIVTLCPCRLAVLEVFERLFFDVRYVLKYPLVMFSTLLHPMVGGWGFSEFDVLYKFIAYVGGADMLVRFINLKSDMEPEDWRWFGLIIRNVVSQNAIQAANTTRITPENQVDIQELQLKFKQALEETLVPGASSSTEELVDGIINAVRSVMSKHILLCPTGAFGRTPEVPMEQKIADRVNRHIVGDN